MLALLRQHDTVNGCVRTEQVINLLLAQLSFTPPSHIHAEGQVPHDHTALLEVRAVGGNCGQAAREKARQRVHRLHDVLRLLQVLLVQHDVRHGLVQIVGGGGGREGSGNGPFQLVLRSLLVHHPLVPLENHVRLVHHGVQSTIQLKQRLHFWNRVS